MIMIMNMKKILKTNLINKSQIKIFKVIEIIKIAKIKINRKMRMIFNKNMKQNKKILKFMMMKMITQKKKVHGKAIEIRLLIKIKILI